MTSDQIRMIESLPGWCSPLKRDHMTSHAISMGVKLFVEIGVFGGRSLLPVSSVMTEMPDTTVVGIDPWLVEASVEGMKNQDNITYWSNEQMYSEVYEAVKHAISAMRLKNITLLRACSDEVVGQFADESIDMLHIDGNHSYEPCKRDCLLYLPKVRHGGIIYMDDEGWTEGGMLTVQPNVAWMIEHGCKRHESVDGCAVLVRE